MSEKVLAVDRIYCISIRDRVDRQAMAKANLGNKFGPLEFWLVDRDPEDPVRGCYNSHRQIAQHSLEAGYERVLIFEDDAVADMAPNEAQLNRVNRFLRDGKGDLFYLGGLLGEIGLIWHLGVVRASLYCTHAYVMQRSGMAQLAGTRFSGLPIDVLYKTRFHAYASFPLWYSQVSERVSSSDIAASRDDQVHMSTDTWRRNRRSQYLSILNPFLPRP